MRNGVEAMDTAEGWDVDLLLEAIGGYISDMGFVRETIEEIMKTEDPLSELDLMVNRSNGTRKGDLRILYNVMARV